MSEKLLLIDGHSLLFRAFYGMPIGMTAPDGLHTNALYGFIAVMNKVIDDVKPDYLAAAFDLSTPTFRHEMYPDYKGTRKAAPDEFREQAPVIKRLLEEMEIPVLTREGYEADDILGTLARQASLEGIDSVILSGDRDLLQLVSGRIHVLMPKTRGGNTQYLDYGAKEVEEEFGVTPDKFIELKALMGDTSDNVPGLPGVGPKTAASIMTTFGSIEEARARLDEIKPKKAMEAMRDHYDDLQLSLKLVTIDTDAPVAFSKDDFRLNDIYTDRAYESFKALGFKSFLQRFEKKELPQEEAGPETVRISGKDEIKGVIDSCIEAGKAAVSLTRASDDKAVFGITCGEAVYAVAVTGKGAGASSDDDKERGDNDDIFSELRRLVESGAKVYTCDAKGLFKLIRPSGRFNVRDCVIGSYLLDPLKSDWSYDSVSAAHLGKNVTTAAEIWGDKRTRDRKSEADLENDACRISTIAAKVAYDAGEIVDRKLEDAEMLTLFDEIEMPLSFVLADMELKGILTSREELANYSAMLGERIDELEKGIYEDAGEVFNINSPKQLGSILFEKLGIKGGKKTKTGYSTAADVLEKLAPEYPIASKILEYRTYSKLKSTYADGLPEYIDADGRIRTSFNQTVTATGRLSSADPNLQNIPMREELGRRIRKCFYPREGAVFVDADYSQIELRILAHMSGDEKLIEAYRSDRDIHRITASQVFHIPFEDVTETERRNAKAVNFGIVYGISSFGLSQGLSISRGEAAEYIEKYFLTYPGIKAFLDGLVSSAKEKGYAVSLFGRRRPIPELRSSNFMQRSFGERAAMNSPIQGTAADIMKIAMIRVYDRLKRELPTADLILQIHDELLIEVDAKDAEKAAVILREEMENAADLSVKLEADCHTGKDWYEAK